MDNDGITRKVARPTAHKLASADTPPSGFSVTKRAQLREMAANHPDGQIREGARQLLKAAGDPLVTQGPKTPAMNPPSTQPLTSRGDRKPQLQNVAPASTVDSVEHDHVHRHDDGQAVVEHTHPHVHDVRHGEFDASPGIHDHHHVDGKGAKVDLATIAVYGDLAENRDFNVRKTASEKLAGIRGVSEPRRNITKARLASTQVTPADIGKMVAAALTPAIKKSVADLADRINALQERAAPRKL